VAGCERPRPPGNHLPRVLAALWTRRRSEILEMVVPPAVQNGAALVAGMVCGAKRIRSDYLPLVRGRPPGLSTRSSPKGQASLSTINGATMRLCRADLPAQVTRRGCPSAEIHSASLKRVGDAGSGLRGR